MPIISAVRLFCYHKFEEPPNEKVFNMSKLTKSYFKEIKLIGVYPPIEKMDGPFHLLVNCEKFSLSTNMISNINNLQAFKTLKVLSLGRNVIKNLQVRTKLFRNPYLETCQTSLDQNLIQKSTLTVTP